MPPAAAQPAAPHAPARALFPQACSHDTHYLNHMGDLYTALITGGNRLLLVKNGTVLAQSGPLFDYPTPPSPLRTGGVAPCRAIHASAETVPCVYVVTICPFLDDALRLAVATTAGIFLFEYDDAGVLWQDTRPSSFWRTTDGEFDAPGEGGTFMSGHPSPSSPLGPACSAARYSSLHGRQAGFQPSSTSPLGLRSTAATAETPARESAKRTAGVTGRLRWRRIAFSLHPPPPLPPASSAAGAGRTHQWVLPSSRGPASSTLSATGGTGGTTNRTVVLAPIRVAAPSRAFRVNAMDFASAGTLCVVLETEAVLIHLGNSNADAASAASTGVVRTPYCLYEAGTSGASQRGLDRVIWRSLGVYRDLAVCRLHHHVALSLGKSSIVVFTSRLVNASGQSRGGAAVTGDVDEEGEDPLEESSRTPTTTTTFSTATSSFFGSPAPPVSSTAMSTAGRRIPVTAMAALRAVGSPDSRGSSLLPTPAFSPTTHPGTLPMPLDGGARPGGPSSATERATPYLTLARQGLTASVGIYHITDMRWHRVSSHTLLCVTCIHPQEDASFMMLFTVQSLSTTRRYTNVMEEHADGGWGLCNGGYEGDGYLNSNPRGGSQTSENIVQLVPAGVIALAYTPASCGLGPSSSAEQLPLRSTPLSTAWERSTTSAAPISTANWGTAKPPPLSEMHTGLVPNLSRSAAANSVRTRMEFVHVEGDGTVRTSSYAFGRQKHASFSKQRAAGLACTTLLQPLLHLYGSLVRVQVLPPWRTRPMELGQESRKRPHAVEVLLNASRRYRLVLRFTSGVVLCVMVDLSAGVYRTECFLALGAAPLLGLQSIAPAPIFAEGLPPATGTTTVFLVGLLGYPAPAALPPGKPRRTLTAAPSFVEAGEVEADSLNDSTRSTTAPSSTTNTDPGLSVPPSVPRRRVWAIVLLQVEPSGLQARVLTVAPLSDATAVGSGAAAVSAPARGRFLVSTTGSEAFSSAVVEPAIEAPVAIRVERVVTEQDVAAFITAKCPEKLRFMPTLLKATQQDAGRLLTQLTAKYGPLDPVVETQHADFAAVTPTSFTAPPLPPSPAVSPCTMRVGYMTEEGEVVLLLTAGSSTTTAAAALVVVQPPCLASFAPVQRLVAAGSAHVPFVPVAASYTPVPSVALDYLSLSAPRSASASGSTVAAPPLLCDSAAARQFSDALFMCQRLRGRLQDKAVVQCTVEQGSEREAAPYVRVCSPLSRDGTDPSVPTPLQYLPLPPSLSSTSLAGTGSQEARTVLSVKGTLLVNNDVVVGVLCAAAPLPDDEYQHEAACGRRTGTLFLYGCPAVQSLSESVAATDAPSMPSPALRSAFVLEATLSGVETFYLSSSGEVVVLRAPVQAGPPVRRFERWLRCFPTSDRTSTATDAPGGSTLPSMTEDSPSADGYTYVQDSNWCPPCAQASATEAAGVVTAITTLAVAGAWEANVAGLSAAAKLLSHPATTRPVLYAMGDSSFIHLRQLPLRSGPETTMAALSGLASARRVELRNRRRALALAAVPQYHPDAVMQLIGMARWSVLARVLRLVLDAAKTSTATFTTSRARKTDDAAKGPLGDSGEKESSSDEDGGSLLFTQPPEELARRLCTSTVARGFQDRPQVMAFDDVQHHLAPAQLSAEALLWANTVEGSPTASAYSPHRTDAVGTATTTAAFTASAGTAPQRLYDLTATCGDLFAELTQVLPEVTLRGLQSQDQLKLLCILQALRDTLPLSRSVDEAAARYLFFTRLMSLGRRLRLANFDMSAAAAAAASVSVPGVPVNSVLFFEVGQTATRTVATAAYLWAAMSDSQSTVVSLLFDKTSVMYLDGGSGGGAAAANGEIAWEQVEQSGVAFWLRSAADLRSLADRVARQQYQRTKTLTSCALLYCAARKVGTLAALAKAQNNTRLQAFFSRDFAGDEKNRAAASANAYAAMSKNMPEYGAAFFLLAGDVRSAAQVLLQRCRNPALALFVLRAAGEGLDAPSTSVPASSTLLEWYAQQRAAEVEACGPLDMWEIACLRWIDTTATTLPAVTVQRRVSALRVLVAHPTAHPEVLCAARYARECIAALAYHADHFLSPAQETVCLLRLGRYCVAHRLDLNGFLHYYDAARLLDGLRVAETQRQAGLLSGEGGDARSGDGGKDRRSVQPKMAADFNTGTLVFRGFDSDEEDDTFPVNAATGATPGVDGDAEDTTFNEQTAFVLSDAANAAVQAEVHYAYLRTGALPLHTDAAALSSVSLTMDAGDGLLSTEVPVTSYEDILRRLLLCFTAASAFMSPSSVASAADTPGAATALLMTSTSTGASNNSTSSSTTAPRGPFEHLLSVLLRQLIVDMPGNRPADLSNGSGGSRGGVTGVDTRIGPPTTPVRPLTNMSLREPVRCAVEGWYSLCIPLLHLLLGKVALQSANYLVLISLQRLPVSTDGVIEAAEAEGLLEELYERAAATARRGGVGSGGVEAFLSGSVLDTRNSPLYLPLVAFFRLLGRHIMRSYAEVCAAAEAQDGASGGRGVGQWASPTREPRADRTGGKDGDGTPTVQEAEEETVHKDMFVALMAAAAAAEAAANATRGGRGAGRRQFESAAMNGAEERDPELAEAEAVLLDSTGTGRSTLTPSAQVALLLACCQAQLQMRLLEHLRQLARVEVQAAAKSPTTRQAIEAGILFPPPLSPGGQSMLLQRRLLLCTMLLDVTAQWAALSEEVMLRLYFALPAHAPGPLTDPNGIFLEVRRDVHLMRAVLVALLAAPAAVIQAAASAVAPSEPNASMGSAQHVDPVSVPLSLSAAPRQEAAVCTTAWLEENTSMLLELCMAPLELFWTLPSHALSQCRPLSIPTKAVVRVLQRSTSTHAAARRLMEGMLRPVPTALLRLVDPTSIASSASAYSTPGSPLSRGPSAVVGAADTPLESGEPAASAAELSAYCPALSLLQLLWMRRHHTHSLLRSLLLNVTLEPPESTMLSTRRHALTTDRLILTQHHHAVTTVRFDASSCDSVVCSTEAGTSVVHGFRELLAGDNEESLAQQSTERNIATAAFTLGLAAQQARLHLASSHKEDGHPPATVAAIAAKALLEGRPRCGVSANAMPSAHPHLPFFLARHRDGHLDLYPFASQECLATFSCAQRRGPAASSSFPGGAGGALGSNGGWRLRVVGNASPNPFGAMSLTPGSLWSGWGAMTSSGNTAAASPNTGGGSQTYRAERHPVTPVAFSPNGYVFAAGLSDGSVAGWRFSAAAVEGAPAFLFPQLFAPYGLRACVFCGDRSSLLVAVGIRREPHTQPRGRQTGPAAAGISSASGSPNVSRLSSVTNRTAPFANSFALSALPGAVPTGQGATGTAAGPRGEVGEMVAEVMLLDTVVNAGAVTARCALPFVPTYAVYLTPLKAVLLVSTDGTMATYTVTTGLLAVLGTVPVSTVLDSLLGSVSLQDGTSSRPTTVAGNHKSAATAAADAGPVCITCLATSDYDPLVALGTSKGLVLLLHLRHIRAAMVDVGRRASEDGEDAFVYYPPSTSGHTPLAPPPNATGAWLRQRTGGTSSPTPSTPLSATSRAAAEIAAPRMGTEFLRRLPVSTVLSSAALVQVVPQAHSRSAVEDIVFSPSMLLAALREGKVMAAAIVPHALRIRLTNRSALPSDLLEVECE